MTAPTRGVQPTFAPVGEKARWRIVYDLLERKDFDQIITYEEMAEALQLSANRAAHRNLIHQALHRAAQQLSVIRNKSVENVRGVGYRIVLPEEHVRLAGNGQQKAHKTLKLAKRHLDHVDLSKMSDEGKVVLFAAARALSVVDRNMKDMRIRQRQTAELVERVEQAGRETAERVEEQDTQVQEHAKKLRELEDRLARLTGGQAGAPPTT